MLTTTSVLALFASVSAVRAWGALGHETVGYIAQDFVSAETQAFVANILGVSTADTDYIAEVATWADSFRATTAGAWSAPMHFVDALDDPPTTCDVDFTRDCGTFCVISAINNYTTQIEDPTTSATELLDAMRFIIHFVGDIHQPLHDENLDRGGNSIPVTYAGLSTNLHAIWDTNIPEQISGTGTSTSLTSARSFADTLTNDIITGSRGWVPSSWTTGLSLADPISTATSWANEANGYVCTDVIPDGVAAVETDDLSGTYFTDHNHVVYIQLARAGYRLAAWLNLLATGTTGGL